MLPPSHPHYYTAANPVAQIPLPWTPLRKSYWCCTFLHMIQASTVLQAAFVSFQLAFPDVFSCKSLSKSLHPIYNQQCLKFITACIIVQNISSRHKKLTDKWDTPCLSLPAFLPVCCLAATKLSGLFIVLFVY